MKVVLRSSSLAFTLLSIVLNAPISRVKRRAENAEPERAPAEEPRAVSDDRLQLGSDSAYRLHPRPRG
jgi:hypothetical protein